MTLANNAAALTIYPPGDVPYTNTILWYPPQTTYIGYPYWTVTDPPRECSGDVHVFPCPHCATCKCGATSVKHAKDKK